MLAVFEALQRRAGNSAALHFDELANPGSGSLT
jgi:hypothetical protein